jgi:hypothetical protein
VQLACRQLERIDLVGLKHELLDVFALEVPQVAVEIGHGPRISWSLAQRRSNFSPGVTTIAGSGYFSSLALGGGANRLTSTDVVSTAPTSPSDSPTGT